MWRLALLLACLLHGQRATAECSSFVVQSSGWTATGRSVSSALDSCCTKASSFHICRGQAVSGACSASGSTAAAGSTAFTQNNLQESDGSNSLDGISIYAIAGAIVGVCVVCLLVLLVVLIVRRRRRRQTSSRGDVTLQDIDHYAPVPHNRVSSSSVYNVSPAITSDVGDLSRRMSASEYTRLASAVSLRSSSADSTADAMRPYSAMGSAGNAGYGEAVGVNLPKSGSNGSGSSGGVGSNGYVFRKSRAAVQLLDFPTVWVIPFEELVVDKELGRGSFGIVYAGMYGKVRCAVKQVMDHGNFLSADSKELRDFSAECHLGMQLKPHENVVRLLGVCVQPLSLVMEWMAGGSLETLLLSSADISVKQMVTWCNQAIKGLKHLHASGIIHRDLASRNLLLTETWLAKISDFGMARTGSEKNYYTNSNVGPLKWMPEEAIERQVYNVKTDIIMFAEIFLRTDPYPNLSPVAVATRVVRDGLRPSIPPHVPPPVAEAMQQMWAAQANDRISLAEAEILVQRAMQQC